MDGRDKPGHYVEGMLSLSFRDRAAEPDPKGRAASVEIHNR